MNVFNSAELPIDNVNREQLFSDNIDKIKICALHLFKQCHFISLDEREDYMQEAYLRVWISLKKFDPYGSGTIFSWIYTVVKNSFLAYNQKHRKYHDKILLVDNNQSWYDFPDSSDSDLYIDALYLAIEDLPQEKRNIVNYYLNGYDLKQLSRQQGKQIRHYDGVLHQIRKLILKHHKRYFEDIIPEGRKLEVISNGRINEMNKSSKAIKMLGKDGGFIKTFPSIMEAQRNGFSGSAISAVLSGRSIMHKGFRWAYVDDTFDRALERKSLKKREVKQFDMNGNLIRIWESCAATAENGFSPSAICSVARGRAYSHMGYRWLYVGETNELILNMPKPSGRWPCKAIAV